MLLSTASKVGALAVVASCLCHLASGGVVVHGGGGGGGGEVYSGEKICSITLPSNMGEC